MWIIELSDLIRSAKSPSVIDQIVKRAAEVIGSEQEALRWLGTPIRALGYSTPISLLSTPEGKQAVLTTLGRLEHGIL